jgi:endoglucanase
MAHDALHLKLARGAELGRRLALSMPILLLGRTARAMSAIRPLDAEEWRAFKARFLAPDGRVIDTGNDGVSHSEGQGWALLCAVRFDDRASFDLILGWTRRVLARQSDMLHAWRYRPGVATAVDDPNNATDGDLMIAWALLQARRRWGGTEYGAMGTAITRDILRLLVREVDGRTLLLPGLRGFEQRDHVVVNPSYYAFPAFRALAQAVPDPRWLQMAGDGLELLRRGRFGRWQLPPDWLSVSRTGGRLAMPRNWPPRFSYDAIRVPLYMTWAGMADEPAVTAAARFWRAHEGRRPPAWADLTTNALAPYDAPPGVVAVASVIRAAHDERELISGIPSIVARTDYYSAALTLLSRIAWHDSESGSA